MITLLLSNINNTVPAGKVLLNWLCKEQVRFHIALICLFLKKQPCLEENRLTAYIF
jgi:hypothetical protein